MSWKDVPAPFRKISVVYAEAQEALSTKPYSVTHPCVSLVIVFRGSVSSMADAYMVDQWSSVVKISGNGISSVTASSGSVTVQNKMSVNVDVLIMSFSV